MWVLLGMVLWASSLPPPPQKDFLSILFLFRLCVCVCVSACREHDNSKKALAEYFQRTRHVLIKVSSLVRWSANANDVYVCQVPILHPFPASRLRI